MTDDPSTFDTPPGEWRADEVSLRSMPRSSRPGVQRRTAAPRSMDLRRIGCRDKMSVLFLVRFLMPYMSFCPVAVIVRGVGAVIAPTASG